MLLNQSCLLIFILDGNQSYNKRFYNLNVAIFKLKLLNIIKKSIEKKVVWFEIISDVWFILYIFFIY